MPPDASGSREAPLALRVSALTTPDARSLPPAMATKRGDGAMVRVSAAELPRSAAPKDEGVTLTLTLYDAAALSVLRGMASVEPLAVGRRSTP